MRSFDVPRASSPSLRLAHPKARRNILVDTQHDAEVEHFSANGFGRGSPNPFQPIRDRQAGSGLGDEEPGYSGLTNVHDLRRAALAAKGYDPEPMIKACVKVFTTQVQPSYAMPWARGEEARHVWTRLFLHIRPYQTRHSFLQVDAQGPLAGPAA